MCATAFVYSITWFYCFQISFLLVPACMSIFKVENHNRNQHHFFFPVPSHIAVPSLLFKSTWRSIQWLYSFQFLFLILLALMYIFFSVAIMIASDIVICSFIIYFFSLNVYECFYEFHSRISDRVVLFIYFFTDSQVYALFSCIAWSWFIPLPSFCCCIFFYFIMGWTRHLMLPLETFISSSSSSSPPSTSSLYFLLFVHPRQYQTI